MSRADEVIVNRHIDVLAEFEKRHGMPKGITGPQLRQQNTLREFWLEAWQAALAQATSVLTPILKEHLMDSAKHLIGTTPLEGRPAIRRILHIAMVLHKNWEMDNEGWIVELEDKTTAALTTSHGGLCEWSREEAEVQLKLTEDSVASLRRALELIPPNTETRSSPC